MHQRHEPPIRQVGACIAVAGRRKARNRFFFTRVALFRVGWFVRSFVPVHWRPGLWVHVGEAVTGAGRRCQFLADSIRDENRTKISPPHRFLYLIRSNSYFWINLNSVRNSEHQIRNRNENGLDIFSTFFYFSTFNSEYPEFEIRFKPNLTHYKSNLRKIIFFSYDLG